MPQASSQFQRPPPQLAEVANPFHNPSHPENHTNPRKVFALRRSDAVRSLRGRGLLSDQQFAAAIRLQKLFALIESGDIKAADPTRIVVDGGRLDGGVSDRTLAAGNELARIKRLVGARSYLLLVRVCSRGEGLVEIYGPGRDNDRRRCSGADRLREALDDIGDMWGRRR